MRKPAKTILLLTAATAAVAVGLFWSGDIAPRVGASLTTEAQAIIGRPLTPISYAGVARRSIY